jgi:hypothetical protein
MRVNAVVHNCWIWAAAGDSSVKKGSRATVERPEVGALDSPAVAICA